MIDKIKREIKVKRNVRHLKGHGKIGNIKGMERPKKILIQSTIGCNKGICPYTKPSMKDLKSFWETSDSKIDWDLYNQIINAKINS